MSLYSIINRQTTYLYETSFRLHVIARGSFCACNENVVGIMIGAGLQRTADSHDMADLRRATDCLQQIQQSTWEYGDCFLRAHNKGRACKELEWCALTQVEMIAASCTPPAPVLILSLSVVVVVGVACCCCIPFRLVLMLVLTFAPCTLTFAPCACGGCHQQQLTVVVCLPQPLAQRLPSLEQLAL